MRQISLLLIGAHATLAFRLYQNNNAQLDCPISSAKADLNIDKFMGPWYIQEYQYPREMNMADLSCLMFKFYEDATGIMGNFTFRFPPIHGRARSWLTARRGSGSPSSRGSTSSQPWWT